MTKELLLNLWAAQRHLELFTLGAATLLTIGLSVALGLVILRSKIIVSRFGIVAGLVFTYYFISKWFAPHPIVPFIHLLLLGGSLTYISQTSILKSFGAAFVAIMATSTGDFLLMPVVKFIPTLTLFITKTSWGIIITQMAGWITPIIIIVIICKNRKESPFETLKTKELIYSLIMYSAILSLVYHTTVDYFSNKLDTGQFFNMILLIVVFTGGYLALRREVNKRQKTEMKSQQDKMDIEIDAITDHFEEVKKIANSKKTDIKKLMEKELAKYLLSNAESFSLARKVLDDIKENM